MMTTAVVTALVLPAIFHQLCPPGSGPTSDSSSSTVVPRWSPRCQLVTGCGLVGSSYFFCYLKVFLNNDYNWSSSVAFEFFLLLLEDEELLSRDFSRVFSLAVAVTFFGPNCTAWPNCFGFQQCGCYQSTGCTGAGPVLARLTLQRQLVRTEIVYLCI